MHRQLASLFFLLIVLDCLGDIPPGYEFIRVTNSSETDSNPRMNSHGDIVFSARDFPSNANVMFFSNGVLSNVTNDNIGNGTPSISDDGVIVWSRYTGPKDQFGPTPEIVRLKDGVLDYLTDDNARDVGPVINNLGHIVWFKYTYDGCSHANRFVEFFDGTSITHLTDGDYSDQAPTLNNADQIVWTRYDFCPSPWQSSITTLDQNNELEFLSGDEFDPQSPTINDVGTAAWFYVEPEYNALVMLKNGVLTDLGRGSQPKINNHDDIIYTRGGTDGGEDQICVDLRGELYHISDDAVWNGQGQINDRTDMCWMTGDYPSYDIVMLKRLPDGDMNCDKQLNFDDIDGFVAALVGKDAFLQIQPDCDWWLADMNDDRKIDFNDIDPFVTCLINNGCP